MDQHDTQDDKDKKVDESTRILYTTFFIIGVIVFVWLLLVIFSEETNTTIESMNDKDNQTGTIT